MPDLLDNPGRRVTDQDDDDFRETQAVKLERLKSRQTVLENQVKSSIDALRSSVDNMQLETRATNLKINEIGGLQQAHDSNAMALSEVRSDVKSLRSTLEKWFEDFEKEQDQRWREHEHDRDLWRKEHIKESALDKSEVLHAIKDTSDKMKVWSGIGFALMLTGGALISGFLWNLNFRFGRQDELAIDAKEKADSNSIALDNLKDEHHQMELYLARGGVNVRDPYDPAKGKSK